MTAAATGDFQHLGATEDVEAGANKRQLEELLAANTGLAENTKAFLDGKLAEATTSLAAFTATDAARHGPQTALLVPTIHSDGGELSAGGSVPVGRHGAPAYDVLWGTVFGGITHRQFPEYIGPDASYWFFASVDKDENHTVNTIAKAADDAVDKWGTETVPTPGGLGDEGVPGGGDIAVPTGPPSGGHRNALSSDHHLGEMDSDKSLFRFAAARPKGYPDGGDHRSLFSFAGTPGGGASGDSVSHRSLFAFSWSQPRKRRRGAPAGLAGHRSLFSFANSPPK